MPLFKSKPNFRKLEENLDIEALIRALNHRDIAVRKNAADTLVEMLGPTSSAESRQRAGSALFKTVLDPHQPERFESALESLAKSCRDESSYVRWGAAWVLAVLAMCGKRDPRMVDILIDVLKDPSPSTRPPAVRGLAALKDRRAVGPLIVALTSPDRNESPSLAKDIEDALKYLGGPVDGTKID